MSSGGGTRLEVALKVHGSNGKYLAVNLTSITVYMCTCVCWGRGAGRGGEAAHYQQTITPLQQNYIYRKCGRMNQRRPGNKGQCQLAPTRVSSTH